MDAITDVAQNAHGLRVQRRYGRSILNSFHAVWSIGAVTGGLMGAAAVAIGMARWLHLGLSAVLFAGVALSAYRFLLKGHDEDDRPVSDATGRHPQLVDSSARRHHARARPDRRRGLDRGGLRQHVGRGLPLGLARRTAVDRRVRVRRAHGRPVRRPDDRRPHGRPVRAPRDGPRWWGPRRGRHGPGTRVPVRARHDRGLRGGRLRHRDPGPVGHAWRRQPAGPARRHGPRRPELAHAGGLPAVAARRRPDRRRDLAPGRPPRRTPRGLDRGGGLPGARRAPRRGASFAETHDRV